MRARATNCLHHEVYYRKKSASPILNIKGMLDSIDVVPKASMGTEEKQTLIHTHT